MELLDAAYISQLYLWCHCLEIYTHHQVYQIIYLSGLIWWHVHCRFVLYRTHGKPPTFARSLFLSIYVLQPCRHTGSHVQLVVLQVFIFFFLSHIVLQKHVWHLNSWQVCQRGEQKVLLFSCNASVRAPAMTWCFSLSSVFFLVFSPPLVCLCLCGCGFPPLLTRPIIHTCLQSCSSASAYIYPRFPATCLWPLSLW